MHNEIRHHVWVAISLSLGKRSSFKLASELLSYNLNLCNDMVSLLILWIYAQTKLIQLSYVAQKN